MKQQTNWSGDPMGLGSLTKKHSWEDGYNRGLRFAMDLLEEDKKIKEFHNFKVKLQEEINSI